MPEVDLDVEVPEVRLPEAEVDWRAPDVTMPDADLGIRAPEVTLPEAAVGVVGEEPGRRDDLKRIEGIGPKISRLLNEHGIYTFAQVASASTERLQEILDAGGPNYQLADPETWREQARLAADGAWDEFRALQDRLIRGHRAGPRPY